MKNLFRIILLACLIPGIASAQEVRPKPGRPGIQNPNGGNTPVDTPCAATGNVAACWNCFQALLSNCGNLQTGAMQAACYQGANAYFVWCLGRIPVSPIVEPGVSNTDSLIDVGNGLAFTITNATGPVPDDLAIFIDGKPVTAQFVRFQNGAVDAVVQDSGAGILKNGTHSVTITDAHKSFAWAFPAQAVYSPDVNGDGLVNAQDAVALMGQYSRQEISFEQYVKVLQKINPN